MYLDIFKIDDNTYIIENLLINKIIPCDFAKNMFQNEKSEYLRICEYLSSYANYVSNYLNEGDNLWYDYATIHLNEGFNHIKNYNKCKNITEIGENNINIIDSFLILEMRNGAIEISPFDTEDDMLKTLY